MELKDLEGKKILCFGVSPGYTKQLFMKKMVDAGLDLTILKFPDEKYLIEYNRQSVEINFPGSEKEISMLINDQFDCAITYNEFHVERLSRLSTYLNLKNSPLPLENSKACRDKSIMKNQFIKKGIPTAEYAVWRNEKELYQALIDLNLLDKKYILKPREGAASRGITKIESNMTVEDAVNKFYNLTNKCAQQKGYETLLEPPYLIERYIDNYGSPVELSIEGYVYNNDPSIIMVSEKMDMVKEGLFLENKYLSPPKSGFIIDDLEKIELLTKKAVKAVGINNSVFHLEIRYDNGLPLILEVGSRPGGGLISESSKIRTGIDLRLQHLLLSLGEKPNKKIDNEMSTCFGTLYYQENFDLSLFNEAVNYVENVSPFHEIRENVEKRNPPLTDWLIAFGVIGKTPEESYNKFYKTLNQIKLKLTKNG